MDLLRERVKPQRVLDIGAWCGDSALAFQKLWPEAKVVCVEANPACEPHLRTRGLDYHMAVLWSGSGTVEFYRTKVNSMSTGCSIYRELTPFFGDDNYILETMPCTTLDRLFPEGGFDFLKLDTQGSELEILRGGSKLLRGVKFLAIEVSLVAYNEGAPLYREVDDELQRMGFLPVAKVGEGRHPLTGEVIQSDILYASKA